MKTTSILAILAAPLLALAQSNVNPFKVPTSGYATAAGQTLVLNWTPTTSGTVSLYVREGAASNLNPGTEIATDIQNSGTFSWTVPSNIVRGSDYAIEIRSSSGSNYTPQFVIDSSNTVATTASSASASASSSASSASASNSSSASSASKSGSSVMSSASSSASKSASSVSASQSSVVASQSSAAFQTSTSASKGSAPRATAAAGVMGLVALGALAL